jgi:hypothetical protein
MTEWSAAASGAKARFQGINPHFVVRDVAEAVRQGQREEMTCASPISVARQGLHDGECEARRGGRAEQAPPLQSESAQAEEFSRYAKIEFPQLLRGAATE